MTPTMIAALLIEEVTHVLDAASDYGDAEHERMVRMLDAQERLFPKLEPRERNAIYLERDGML